MFYVIGFRYWLLFQGFAPPVNITPFGFRIPTPEEYEIALRCATLGESIFLVCYLWMQRRRIVPNQLSLEPSLAAWLQGKVVLLTALCLPAAVLMKQLVSAQAAAGKSLGFEISSYASLFPFVLVSVVILLAALWKANELRTPIQKLMAVLTVIAVAWLTFGPSGRFQFLGWLVAAIIILMAGKAPFQRSVILVTGIAVASACFGIAGALRGTDVESDLTEDALERVAFAQDGNMLDGFALLLQVYPDRLDYRYGREHLEILLRPIPRSWWPGKPVGGYMNKLGLFDITSEFGLGISQSLFGSFYEEAGVLGVVILSMLYGLGIGRFVYFTTRIHAFAGLLMRAMLCAFLVPLLRGGDLPGMYAWAGMAFWPCFLILWLKRREWFAQPHTSISIAQIHRVA
jgi:oligosaccharide repeat unit polymerase